MKKLIIISTVFLITPLNIFGQDSRKKIKDYINIEIQLENHFAGESLTLIKEKGDFFIIRKIFGSGVPVIRTFKYIVNYVSHYQIEFWEIVYTETFDESEKPKYEKFRMDIEGDGISVYLNNLKLLTEI